MMLFGRWKQIQIQKAELGYCSKIRAPIRNHLSHSNHPNFGQESWATAFDKFPIIVHTSWKSLEIRRSNCLNLFYYIIASSSTNPPKELVQENMDQCQNPSGENWSFKTKWWVDCFDHHFSASLQWKKKHKIHFSTPLESEFPPNPHPFRISPLT